MYYVLCIIVFVFVFVMGHSSSLAYYVLCFTYYVLCIIVKKIVSILLWRTAPDLLLNIMIIDDYDDDDD
ncbi:hypothetical protein T492DRAFT_1041230, partial [Pavlovales sp. CCMP2436]